MKSKLTTSRTGQLAQLIGVRLKLLECRTVKVLGTDVSPARTRAWQNRVPKGFDSESSPVESGIQVLLIVTS